MKKGCLFLIIFIPFTIGVLYYVIDKYGFKFWENTNVLSIENIVDSIENEIRRLPETEYADSVKATIEEYFSEFELSDTDEYINKAETIANQIKDILNENLSDSLNFEKIKQILKSNEQ